MSCINEWQICNYNELISLEDMRKINHDLVSKFGGVGIGFNNKNLAISAIEGCYQEVFGVQLCPTIEDKISHLIFSITKNHIFLDGNKRTSALILNILCKRYNISISIPIDELILNLSNSTISKQDFTNILKGISEG